MIWPLDVQSFAPVLKMLGQGDSDTESVIGVLLFLVSVPAALLIAHTIRKRIRRRQVRERAIDQLERTARQKNLDHIEHAALERLVEGANLQSPAAVLESVDTFDQVAAARVAGLMQGPWLDMEQEVERLSRLRKKLEFRYLPPDRAPLTTRQLHPGQRLFVLAAHENSFRLLSADVLDLDDLAIRTGAFKHRDHRVRLKAGQELWGFFWAANGQEYRFRTRIYKEEDRPSPWVMLAHGDRVFHETDGDIFTATVEASCPAKRLPAVKARSSQPGPKLFEERGDDVVEIEIEITVITGSGFKGVAEEEIDTRDLLLLQGKEGLLGAARGLAGRVHETSGHAFWCAYAGIDDAHRTPVLDRIASRLNRDAVQKKLK